MDYGYGIDCRTSTAFDTSAMLSDSLPLTPLEIRREVEDAEHEAIKAWLDEYVALANAKGFVKEKNPVKNTNWKKLNDREFPRRSDP